MSSTGFALPLRVRPRRSRQLFLLLSLLYGGALLCLVPMTLPLGLKLLVAAPILVSYRFTLRRHLLLSAANAVRELVWLDEQEWILETGDGQQYSAELHGSSYMSPAFVLLNFSVKGKHAIWPVLLLPDSIDHDTLRRLNVRLRWRRG